MGGYLTTFLMPKILKIPLLLHVLLPLCSPTKQSSPHFPSCTTLPFPWSWTTYWKKETLIASRQNLPKISPVGAFTGAQLRLIWNSLLELNPLKDSYKVKILLVTVFTLITSPLPYPLLLLKIFPLLILLCPHLPQPLVENPVGDGMGRGCKNCLRTMDYATKTKEIFNFLPLMNNYVNIDSIFFVLRISAIISCFFS